MLIFEEKFDDDRSSRSNVLLIIPIYLLAGIMVWLLIHFDDYRYFSFTFYITLMLTAFALMLVSPIAIILINKYKNTNATVAFSLEGNALLTTNGIFVLNKMSCPITIDKAKARVNQRFGAKFYNILVISDLKHSYAIGEEAKDGDISDFSDSFGTVDLVAKKLGALKELETALHNHLTAIGMPVDEEIIAAASSEDVEADRSTDVPKDINF